MVSSPKRERIRDPLHNLVEFDSDQFEHVMWKVIQTRPFQRLRRVRQLGFSEFVYPGATHTRFSHSIGVFHTARQLMQIIHRHLGRNGRQYENHQADVALAAALVHDLGHGMFSHAFEAVGKQLNLKMAHHEKVSDALIRNGEIKDVFAELGSGFANDVADVIESGKPGSLYSAVVSSQFDADRLDYMQRDRLMTGVQNSGIDLTWLMANLDVGTIATGVDDQAAGEVETFVLGPKASHAAEAYVLALFQLYPTVYFHKTTRAAEKIFSLLMVRLIELVRKGHTKKTGLPHSHPFVRFSKDPDNLDNALALDDMVFWGALPMLSNASDKVIKHSADRLRDRRLPKCIDVRGRVVSELTMSTHAKTKDRNADRQKVARTIVAIDKRIHSWSRRKSTDVPRIITDSATREPYKKFQESKGPLNQIRIKSPDGKISDVAEISPIVAAIETYELYRAYVDHGDTDAKNAVTKIITEELRRG